MKTRHTLLLATIAFGGLLAVSASGAAPQLMPGFGQSDAASANWAAVNAGYDEEDGEYLRRRGLEQESAYRNGDDDGGYFYGGEDDDEGGGAVPVAPGSTTPPDNGLILKGAAPEVQVN